MLGRGLRGGPGGAQAGEGEEEEDEEDRARGTLPGRTWREKRCSPFFNWTAPSLNYCGSRSDKCTTKLIWGLGPRTLLRRVSETPQPQLSQFYGVGTTWALTGCLAGPDSWRRFIGVRSAIWDSRAGAALIMINAASA